MQRICSRRNKPGRGLRPLIGAALIAIAGLSALRAEAPRASPGKRPEAAAAAVPRLLIRPEDVRPHVEYLASPELEGRGAPKGKRLAADYLIAHYKKLGLEPLFAEGNYLQVIPGKTEEDGTKTVMGHNVGAWLPGSDPQLRDEIVIVSAHYDHLGIREGRIYPGADDNATSVAMTLELARLFTREGERPRRSVAFVNFDLEEYLLWGSRWFAAHPPWPLERVKFFLTADLLGRSLGDLPLPTVFVMGSEYAPALKQIVIETTPPKGLEVSRLGVDLVGQRSDYGPFWSEKIPFLFFSTGEHPDYHTPQDVPARIDYEKLARIASLVCDLTRKIADADEAPAWSKLPEPDLEEVRTIHRITELLLAAEKERPLTDVQRALITHVHNRTAQILERGQITPGERSWMIRSAQLLLFSVF